MSVAYVAVAAIALAVIVWQLTRGDAVYAYFSLFVIPILGFTGGRVLVTWLGETAYRLPRRMRKRWEGLYFATRGRGLAGLTAGSRGGAPSGRGPGGRRSAQPEQLGERRTVGVHRHAG